MPGTLKPPEQPAIRGNFVSSTNPSRVPSLHPVTTGGPPPVPLDELEELDEDDDTATEDEALEDETLADELFDDEALEDETFVVVASLEETTVELVVGAPPCPPCPPWPPAPEEEDEDACVDESIEAPSRSVRAPQATANATLENATMGT
jgi:hypothetical protein